MPNSGEKLKKIRNTLGVSQSEFGRHIGLKWYQVRDLESSKVELTEKLILLISMTYNVPKDFLIHGKGEMFGKLHMLMPWETEKMLKESPEDIVTQAMHMSQSASSTMTKAFKYELFKDPNALEIIELLCELDLETRIEILKIIREKTLLAELLKTKKPGIKQVKKRPRR